MALERKLKVSEKCGRCPREQERVVTLEEAIELAKRDQQPLKPAFSLQMDGTQVADFAFLCDACRDIILGYVNSAVTKPGKASARRTVGKKKKGEAAPAAVPAQTRPLQQTTTPPKAPPPPSQQRR